MKKKIFFLLFLDSNSRSPLVYTSLLPKSPTKKSNEEPCRFTRELEQRLQNGLFIFFYFYLLNKKFLSIQIGDISEEAKHAYNLLINGRTNSSLLSHDEHSHSTTNEDLSSNNNEQENNSKQSPNHPTTTTTTTTITTKLFGSSSSSSTSISTSSTSNNTQSNTSSSSNQQKSDRHSHYSSTSTDNDISIDLKPQNELSPLK
jgi:hypothetical protein